MKKLNELTKKLGKTVSYVEIDEIKTKRFEFKNKGK